MQNHTSYAKKIRIISPSWEISIEKTNRFFFYTQIPGWELVRVDGILRLRRSWKVKNFVKGLDFFHRLAQVAEAAGLKSPPTLVFNLALLT